ncbi:MAG: 2-iminoacetate synthase ThiH [Acidobacteria bacterium]|nr:2-iminoacetate synthase ThiH [Acidobacteriota bacterium]
MSFLDVMERTPVREIAAHSGRASAADVERALSKPAGARDLWDFAALLGPSASERIEDLAAASRRLTERRFGRTVHMYAPLYLSNDCLSTCSYCGFARTLPVARQTLPVERAGAEGRLLAEQGFRHLLLLTGEHQKLTGVDFLVEHVRALSQVVPQISLEVQVWSEEQYRALREAGCDGVVIYQETYDRGSYRRFHIAGKKRRYEWRIEGPERAARAGIRRIGIGALLGLHEPWREEAVAVAAHAQHLTKVAWRQELTVSVPRLRPSASGYSPEHPVTDRELVQLICALRLLLPDVGLVLSTREEAELRDRLVPLGITHTSAGSHTEPGGYGEPDAAGRQFEVADGRSVAEVVAAIRAMGYEAVWKDWDRTMSASAAPAPGGNGRPRSGVAPVSRA